MLRYDHAKVVLLVGWVLGAGLGCGETSPGDSARPSAGAGGAGASGGSGGASGGSGKAGASTGGANTGGASTGGANTGGTGESGGSAGKGGTSGNVGGSGGFAGSGNPPLANGKVDLLFMVDTSRSMGGKQKLLSDAMPYLLTSLTSELGVTDLHLGIITSSLSDHGSADVCSPATADAMTFYDDRAQLLPSVRTGVTSWNDQGFLLWDPSQSASPPGENDAAALSAAAQAQLAAASEVGCGYEAQLESLYRFLVDPEPVQAMSNDGNTSVRGPVNHVVLAQRAAFLRPDSTLVVVLLTDENDCSIIDETGSQAWVTTFTGRPRGTTFNMPAAAPICETNPNDPTCGPTTTALAPEQDHLNLRCYRQKQRFGIDLLYPISRYVDAFSAAQIDPRQTSNPIPNPLYFAPGGSQTRTPEQVFVLGIVGVPWQDVSSEASWAGPGLDYLTAADLRAEGRWPVIVGNAEENVPPSDPLMVEAIDPRPAGTPHPLLGDAAAVVSEESSDATANPINGHEQRAIDFDRSDLQFACIFPLAEPRPCVSGTDAVCDCEAYDYPKNSPLCSYPGPDMDGTQLYGKAYPSLRELEVLQGLGDQAVVASVCPKKTAPDGTAASDPEYGYNPAITALIEAMRQAAAP
jgi:hypothetical protein